MASEKWTRDRARMECNARHWVIVQEGWYDARSRRNHDICGVFDIIALPAVGGPTKAIQFTSVKNVSARRAKILAHPEVGLMRDAGWELIVWGIREDGSIREEVLRHD